MFTGIIEETGRVERVTRGAKSSRLRIRAGRVLEDTRAGDSICTSGVCLTVAKLEGDCFEADVTAETTRRSKLGSLATGSRVNLERAIRLDGRLGGHMVSGHIDGTGAVRSLSREENAVWLSVSAGKELLRYIVEKGSVAVDGVSLTVASVDREGFRVSVIPHTGRETTLLQLKIGDAVNLECDIVGKYVEKLLGQVQGQSMEAAQGQGVEAAQHRATEPAERNFIGFYG
ncbi:MAG TPA: riboflavin synthase [Anaerovoracaceae bacterium]|nr:riboflavin synthase [Anaerovoracaceae bacterium]